MIRIFYVKPMCLLGFLIAALTLPTWAHHSHNAYEVTVWEDIAGTVSEVHFINPHSWLYLNVTDENGEIATWSLDCLLYTSPSPRDLSTSRMPSSA